MKLVDILARELSEWPEQYVAVIQDEGGNLHGCLSQNDPTDLDQEDLPFNPVTVAWDGANTIINRAEWQAAVDALKSEECAHDYANKHGCPECGETSAPAWTGEGLPPVGTVCEVDGSSSATGWGKCTIRYSSSDVIVFKRDEYDFESFDCVASAHSFRPIRTPEQIAADERLHAIRNALTTIKAGRSFPGDVARQNVLVATVEAMIDAGYCKQAKP